MSKQSLGTALVTGASSGIGAVYADRLAKRGYDLVLVARDEARMNEVAQRLRAETGVSVEVLKADLTVPADRKRVEQRLRADTGISLLINNAGMAILGGIATADVEAVDTQIQLNVTALTRLAAVASERFAAAGKGAIVNIGSVLGFAPELTPGSVYPATKAFVIALSQSMHLELAPKGIYVQAVLPAATRTEIWAKAGRDVNQIPGVMDVEELVDAALVGFDRREPITIPPLPDAGQWDAYDAARLAMLPHLRQEHAAARYWVKETVAAE